VGFGIETRLRASIMMPGSPAAATGFRRFPTLHLPGRGLRTPCSCEAFTNRLPRVLLGQDELEAIAFRSNALTYELTKRIAERVVMTLQTHVPHRIVKLDASDRSITVANLGGGETVLRARSADRPVGLLGDSIAAVIVDEAAQIHERVWTEHLAPRLLDCDGSALLLSTPDGGGWFYEEFKRAKSDPAYASWSFPTSANPRIDKDLVEAERKRLPAEVFRAQYGAEFVGVPLIPCDVCHGPTRWLRTFVMVEGADELGTCPACERLVDGEGESIVPLRADGTEGEPRIVKIIGSPDEPPKMPANPAS